MSCFFRDVPFDNDISVLTLAEKVEFSNTVVPACLPDPTYHDYIGEFLTVSGWGAVAQGGQTSDTLQAVDVPYITNSICSGDKTEYRPSEITENMMCAGNITHGSIDSCQGDSGGTITI